MTHTERHMQTDRSSSAGSLPDFPQQPGLSHGAARSPELNPAASTGTQQQEAGVGAEPELEPRHSDTRCRRPTPWLHHCTKRPSHSFNLLFFLKLLPLHSLGLHSPPKLGVVRGAVCLCNSEPLDFSKNVIVEHRGERRDGKK